MLLLFVFSTGPPSIVDRPGFGDMVQRPAVGPGVTVDRPGGGDLVQRPDAATGATPWTR